MKIHIDLQSTYYVVSPIAEGVHFNVKTNSLKIRLNIFSENH